MNILPHTGGLLKEINLNAPQPHVVNRLHILQQLETKTGSLSRNKMLQFIEYIKF